MEAKEKDKMLYTSPNWESLIANIMVGKVYGATALKAAMSFHW
jgi:hypothetical protein